MKFIDRVIITATIGVFSLTSNLSSGIDIYISKYKNTTNLENLDSNNSSKRAVEDSSQKKDHININFNNMYLDDFIKLISTVTRKNVIVNTELERTKIKVVGHNLIKSSSFIKFADTILRAKGYKLLDHGDFFEVVRTSEATDKR